MAKLPDQKIFSNHWGSMFLGPIGEELKISENTNSCAFICYRSGYTEIHTLEGNRQIRVVGRSDEIYGEELGSNRDEPETEAIAKSITCENGDLVLSAPNGRIKLLAENIDIECVGAGSDGSILMKANDHITMRADEQLNLSGGKVCVTSADSITLNAKGFLRLLYADVMQGSPLSGALSAFLPGPVASLISDIAETCK